MAIRWAIYGLGLHAERRMGPALKRAQDTELAAVCSRDMVRARAFASRFEVPRAYDSYDAMLADPDVDVVYIATPNHLHREHAEKAAAAGKDILCEKPMALREEDCQAMIEACQRARVILGVAFQNRHHPAHIEARRLVREGEAGDVTMASVRWSRMVSWEEAWRGWKTDFDQSGGLEITAVGVHLFDLLRFVLDREAEEVAAFSDEDLANDHPDENWSCLLRFQGGAQSVAQYGRYVPHMPSELMVYGTQARLAALGTVGVFLRGNLGLTRGDVTTEVSYSHPNPQTGLYERLIESFNNCVLERTEPSATGYDGLAACRMANAALASAREGRTVAIRPD